MLFSNTISGLESYIKEIVLISFKFIILDDIDGHINPGEQIELTVILLNNPNWGEAIDASFILSSTNSNITIANPDIYIGNINPGDVGMNIENPFLISFNSNISDSLVEVNLNFVSNLQDYIQYTTSIPILFEIHENSIIIGDINEDLTIDILDVVQLVNIVLGASSPSSYQLEAGDMNQDNLLNIQDIVILVNLILN